MGNLIIVYLVAFVYAIATCHPYYQGKNNLDVVVYGITATRHHVSGEIPGFDKGEKFTPTYNPGALIKFFISNRSETDTILPTVRFNGKTGKELLEAGIVSYCNTPEIRESNTALSSKIPPSCIDLYVLNVTDSNFYSKGIRLTIDDRLSSKSFGQDLKIEEHLLAAERILFTSSDMSKHPDGFRVYLRNKGSEMVTVTGINFFESSGDTRKHWWIEQPEEGDAEWFGRRNVVPAGDFNGAYVKTGKLPFGELLVEINYKKGRDRYKEIFNIKPLIIDFSFGMGWAEKDLAGSNAFCRTMSLLHLNTVNGNASGFFSQADKATKYEVKKFARLQDVEVQNRPENQFVSSGRRKIEMEFSIPDYLYDCKTVAKITNDGVLKMKVSTTDGKINITDNVETTAIYILYNEQESDVYDSLLKRFNKLIESEKALGFNPITNDNDFNTLVKEIQELAKIK